MDPTAPAGAAAAAAVGALGSGLAGAHGVLGRCTWFRVRLASAAMEGVWEGMQTAATSVQQKTMLPTAAGTAPSKCAAAAAPTLWFCCYITHSLPLLPLLCLCFC
jgi:hypothetical protein